MNDFFFVMHVPQNRQKADQESPDYKLLKKLVFLALVSDELRKIGTFDDLHNNVKIVLFDKGLVELNDVGVL